MSRNRQSSSDLMAPHPRKNFGSRFGMVGCDLSGFVARKWRKNLLVGAGEGASPWRVLLLMVGFVFFCSVVGARIVDVTMPQYRVAAISEARAAPDPGEQRRPVITDRKGRVLAIDVATASLFGDPAKISDINFVARELASVLPVEEKTLRARLDNPQRRFVWLARYLTPHQRAQIHDLGLPGIGFRKEHRRVYPHSELFSHILGYANIDNQGLAGFEKFLDESGSVGLERRNWGDGGDMVALSLDLQVQHVLRDELLVAMEEFRARGATACMIDTRTGEVVAMVSLPDFDPNHPMKSPPRARFNQATLGVYEAGSVFKSFTIAMAMESGGLEPEDVFDARHPLRVGRYSIEDFHPQARTLNVAEILVHSSNIGAAKLALHVEEKDHREFLQQLGFLQSAVLEVPEVGAPLLPRKWGDVERATLSFGYSVSVSPLQLVSAAATLVNGGFRITPTIVRRDAPLALGERKQILSEDTSHAMRGMLRQVVRTGTGRKADVEGYNIVGKTGTAEKIGANGRYDKNRRRTFFMSAFPVQEPRYALLVMLDEPKGHKGTYGFATGGWTAAPVSGRIIERVAPILGVHPVEHDPTPERFARLVAQP